MIFSEIKGIDYLEIKIIEEVASVRPEMLVKTLKEFESRLDI